MVRNIVYAKYHIDCNFVKMFNIILRSNIQLVSIIFQVKNLIAIYNVKINFYIFRLWLLNHDNYSSSHKAFIDVNCNYSINVPYLYIINLQSLRGAFILFRECYGISTRNMNNFSIYFQQLVANNFQKALITNHDQGR